MAVSESDYVWAALSEKQIAWCDRWAGRRQGNAEDDELRGHNNAPEDHDTALSLHVLGLRGEGAAYPYFKPVEWTVFAKTEAIGNTLADFEGWIDIKTRRKAWHSLMVQRDDPPHWAYVLVCAQEHPRYCLIGWCYGHEAQQEEFWDDPKGGRPAFFIKRDNPILKPVAELVIEVRARQRKARAGKVYFDENGRFIHYCHCGEWGGQSIGAHVTQGKLGEWFCPEHFPGIKEEQGRWW